jgi:hypothetical protein
MNTLPTASIKSLIFSSIASIVLAAIILLIAVLPAEYNIDPTGLGKKLGLTVLAQTHDDEEVKPAVISCPDTEKVTDEKVAVSTWQDSVMITVPPKKGLEYKFHVIKGEKLEFVWKTDGSVLYFDFHGEPQGNTTGYFKSFKESTQSESSGTLVAPFTGSHGWYWENKTNKTVVINLKTRGQYKIKGLM